MNYKIISVIAVVIILGIILVYSLGGSKNEVEQTQNQENPVVFEGEENEFDQNQNEQEFLSGGIYSFEEIQKHNTRDDCWLVIHGKVYDVTDFIDKHPGGDAILQGCGKDATELFETRPMGSGTPHSQKARENLENYYIGDVGK